LTIVAVLASGVFLLVAVNAFHQDPRANAPGTGNFAWYAETTAPVYEQLPGAVEMRVREGDDASCLNLNRAQQPRLLGVRPEDLAKRNAFGGKWESLHQPGDAVPAIGDEATVKWALGKKVGDTLPYTDEHGRTFQLRIVGMLPSSILQGSLVISERNFIEKFPSASGYRVFLMDAMTEELARSLEDKGFEAVPTWRRLAEFSQVENTYLGIFQALGGLGLLLGSVGLAIVVLRNVMERRGELALLQAVGFERRKLRWLVLSEHWLLVLLGVALGTGAALVAVWPQRAHGVPVLTLALLAAGGLFWSWLAARIALRGPLLPALRNE
jgi:ABC-type lipoprotein release transport system permease subunit